MPAVPIDREIFTKPLEFEWDNINRELYLRPEVGWDACYLNSLDRALASSSVAEFEAYLGCHADKIGKFRFRDSFKRQFPAARFGYNTDDAIRMQVLHRDLARIARSIVTNDEGEIKPPHQITDTDITKLEIMRVNHGFEYMSRLRFNEARSLPYVDYSAEANKTAEFEFAVRVPFAVYLARGGFDLSAPQLKALSDLLDRQNGYSLLMSNDFFAQSPYFQTDKEGFTILHEIMSNSLQGCTNKKNLASRLVDILPDWAGRCYEVVDSFISPTESPYRKPTYGFVSLYECAARSGDVGNIEFLAEKGIVLETTARSHTSGDAFGNALIRAGGDIRHPVCYALLKVACKQGNIKELLEHSRGLGSHFFTHVTGLQSGRRYSTDDIILRQPASAELYKSLTGIYFIKAGLHYLEKQVSESDMRSADPADYGYTLEAVISLGRSNFRAFVESEEGEGVLGVLNDYKNQLQRDEEW